MPFRCNNHEKIGERKITRTAKVLRVKSLRVKKDILEGNFGRNGYKKKPETVKFRAFDLINQYIMKPL